MPSPFGPPLHDLPDRSHRRLLEHPANLRELVQQAAPPVAEGLDFDHAQLLRRDQSMPNWRRSENDLLFAIPFRSAAPDAAPPTLVSVLVEHQSKPDPAMPLRTLLEATLHWTAQWQAWQDDHPPRQPLRLSPLLAIIFHTGKGAWKGYRTLTDLMELPAEFRKYVPVWKPVFWHLWKQPPEGLQHAAGEWLRTMALVRLLNAPRERFEQAFAEVTRSLEPLAARDKMRWHDLMEFVVTWGHYRRGGEEELNRLSAIATESHQNVGLREEIQTMSRTTKQNWFEWIEARFTAERRAEGALQARREDLRDVLEERFGQLPEAVRQQIAACEDLSRLKRAIRQVVHLRSLAEFQL